MTEYLKPKFSVHVGGQAYRDGWERIFKRDEMRELTETTEELGLYDEPVELTAETANIHGVEHVCYTLTVKLE